MGGNNDEIYHCILNNQERKGLGNDKKEKAMFSSQRNNSSPSSTYQTTDSFKALFPNKNNGSCDVKKMTVERSGGSFGMKAGNTEKAETEAEEVLRGTHPVFVVWKKSN